MTECFLVVRYGSAGLNLGHVGISSVTQRTNIVLPRVRMWKRSSEDWSMWAGPSAGPRCSEEVGPAHSTPEVDRP